MKRNSHPPFELLNSQAEARLGLDKNELILRDMMTILDTVTSKLANHDARLANMAP